MTYLFSKWVVNNYCQGGGAWVEIGGVWNILENPKDFKRFTGGGGSENVMGYSTLKYAHQYDGMKMQ